MVSRGVEFCGDYKSRLSQYTCRLQFWYITHHCCSAPLWNLHFNTTKNYEAASCQSTVPGKKPSTSPLQLCSSFAHIFQLVSEPIIFTLLGIMVWHVLELSCHELISWLSSFMNCVFMEYYTEECLQPKKWFAPPTSPCFLLPTQPIMICPIHQKRDG